jgi:hypothetical protein
MSAIRRDDVRLAYNIEKQRGGWSGLLLAIREDPDSWRPYHTWTREEILEGIRQRAFIAAVRNVFDEDVSFVLAAKRLFGSWFDAVLAAGLDADSYRAKGPSRHWTPGEVRKAITARKAKGLAVTSGHVKRNVGGLYRAARQIFGSWKGALVSSAEPVTNPRQYWSKKKVTNAIRMRYAKELPVSQAYMQPRKLIGLGVSLFGCWANALREAGLDPEQVGLPNWWSIDRVKAVIRQRGEDGIPINACSIRRGEFQDTQLYEAAIHYFDSWDRALSAAGFYPGSVRLRRKWSPAKVNDPQ